MQLYFIITFFKSLQVLPYFSSEKRFKQLHYMVRKLISLIVLLCILGCQKEKSEYYVSTKKENGKLVFSIDKNLVLSYQYDILYPPEGVDSTFKRSGFIHPLKTLSGHTLTQIHPKDHWHHFGIWNPWTQVLFKGDTLDFWNIGGGGATIRFAEFKNIDSTTNSATLTALHEHVVLRDDSEEVALNELQTITVTRETENFYILDLKFEYHCASNSPFKILKHRYAGLGWRATEAWNAENSQVLSSEGNTRENVDGTTGKWCIVQGALGNDYGGSVMLSHPDNYNYPEPLRIWPKEQHNGAVFANFAPTKTKDWLLKPDSTYTLKYRMVVFDGKVDAEKAEKWWQEFSKTVK